MSTHGQHHFNPSEIIELPYWHPDYSELTPLSDGTHAQAYSFETPQSPKVLRIDPLTDYGFQKDRYAAFHFAAPALPIPRIDEIGQLPSGPYYAISDKADGQPLDVTDHTAEVAVRIITSLDALHTQFPGNEGFGWWDNNGAGQQSSWHNTLLAFRYLAYDGILNASGANADALNAITAACDKLLAACPEERRPIHGDLRRNILVNHSEITAFIDWSHAMYGDPLFDVAMLDFTFPWVGYAAQFNAYYQQARGYLPPNYTERLLCYQLLSGISDAHYYAENGQSEAYSSVMQRLIGLIT